MNCPNVIAIQMCVQMCALVVSSLVLRAAMALAVRKFHIRVSRNLKRGSRTTLESNRKLRLGPTSTWAHCYSDDVIAILRARVGRPAGEFASLPLFLFSSSSSSSSWRYERRRVEIGSKGGSRRDGTRLESLSSLFYFCSASTLVAGHGAVYKWFK
jgi:hypothetical protein